MQPYPKPEVAYQGYSDLHFATENQMHSWYALANTDRGMLTLSPGRVTFHGMNFLVDCNNVSGARLVRKQFPWAIAAAVGVLAAVAVYLMTPQPITWRSPGPYILLTVFLIACAHQWRQRWVEVTYEERGIERRAYFRREPVFLGSGAARTRQLLTDIERGAITVAS